MTESKMKGRNKKLFNIKVEKEFLQDYLSVLHEEVNSKFYLLHKQCNKRFKQFKQRKTEGFQAKLRKNKRAQTLELKKLKEEWDSQISKINRMILKDVRTEIETHLLISRDIEEEDEISELTYNLEQKMYIKKKNEINKYYVNKFKATYARHVEESQILLDQHKAELMEGKTQYNAAISSIIESRKRELADAQVRFIEVVSTSDFDPETKINLIETFTHLRDQIEEALSKGRSMISYSFAFA